MPQTLKDVGQMEEIPYLKPKDMTPGLVIEGTFLNTSVNSEDFDKPAYTYYVETANGKVGINGSGHLNYLMARVPENTYVRIEYVGLQKIKGAKKGSKPAHQFRVQIPEGVAEAVPTTPAPEIELESRVLED
jgi:hypothetical protein